MSMASPFPLVPNANVNDGVNIIEGNIIAKIAKVVVFVSMRNRNIIAKMAKVVGYASIIFEVSSASFALDGE